MSTPWSGSRARSASSSTACRPAPTDHWWSCSRLDEGAGVEARQRGRPEPLAGAVRPALLPGDERRRGRQLSRRAERRDTSSRPNWWWTTCASTTRSAATARCQAHGPGVMPWQKGTCPSGAPDRPSQDPRHRPWRRPCPDPGSRTGCRTRRVIRRHRSTAVRSGALPHGGRPAARWRTPAPEVWTEPSDALADAFRATLQRGVHGLCFSPYLEGQQPGTQIGEAQIRERLKIIRPHTRWIRSFSCTDGHEQTPRIAHELGLKTLVGAWLGTDAAINEREIAGRDRGGARRPCRHRRGGQRGAAARGHERRRTAGLHPAREGRRCPACRWAMSTPITCSRSTRASPPPATW